MLQKFRLIPWWLGSKEHTWQCRRCKRLGFDPWVGKIPWRRKWPPTPVFLPGESHGQRSLAGLVYGVAKSQTGLSDYTLMPFLIYFLNTKKILHWGIADLKFLRIWEISFSNQRIFLKRWEYLTWLLRNLYACQEATVRIGHGTTDWFKIRKGVCQGCILSPCLFNLYAEYIKWNAGWMKHKLESR